ncbi:hypothetical protein ACRAWF_26105 [Streptomyces sp. L7]
MSTTHADAVTWNGPAFHEIVTNDAGRPVLFTNARVLTMDPLIRNSGRRRRAAGRRPARGRRPGHHHGGAGRQRHRRRLHRHDGGTGRRGHGRPGRRARAPLRVRRDADPRNTGDLLVVPDELAPDVAGAVATLLTRPEEVRALVANGKPVLWAGTDLPAAPPHPRRASRPPRS